MPQQFTSQIMSMLILLGLSGHVWAHALLHEEATNGSAITLHFFYPGEREKPWFEPYEVFSPGDKRSFQEGRVNAAGEVSFRPNESGEWRIRVATADGHGKVVRIQVSDDNQMVHDVRQGYTERAAMAVGYLLGGFGLIMLWRERKQFKSDKGSD